MCELLALNANAPVAATFSFAGLSARGGLTGDHVDGWGIAFHDGAACRVFVDDSAASRSPLAAFLQQHPIKAPTVLAHVRKATQGAVSPANCHPFRREWAGRHWVFAHNGDLKGFAPPLDGRFVPVGETDSERALCWLLQRLHDRFDGAPLPPWPVMAEAMRPWLADIATHGVFNMLLGDGRALLAHASTRLVWLERRHPFGRVRLIDRDLELDLAVANAAQDRMALVATAALTHDEPWNAFAPGEMRVFEDGRTTWHSRGSTAAPATRSRRGAVRRGNGPVEAHLPA